MGKFTISMAIFNSYVELPEGSSFIFPPFTLFPLVKSASLLNYQILARFKFLSGLGHQQNSDRLVYITLVQKYNPRFPSDHPQPAFIDLWYALVESSPGHPIEGDDQPFLMGKKPLVSRSNMTSNLDLAGSSFWNCYSWEFVFPTLMLGKHHMLWGKVTSIIL
jgi:hypothetical protein